MKRRLRFSIVTLLAIVTVSACGVHWYATWHRLAMARHQPGAAKAGREVGVADDKDVYGASVKLLRVEQAMPFSNRRDACARHLELTKGLEDHWRALPRTAVVGGDPADFSRECDEKAGKIRPWVEEAQ